MHSCTLHGITNAVKSQVGIYEQTQYFHLFARVCYIRKGRQAESGSIPFLGQIEPLSCKQDIGLNVNNGDVAEGILDVQI